MSAFKGKSKNKSFKRRLLRYARAIKAGRMVQPSQFGLRKKIKPYTKEDL